MRKAKILCLGRNLELMRTRCAVLATEGYEAQAAIIPEGFNQIEGFDLLIVSARLVEEYGRRCLPAGVPTLVFDGFVYPIQLIRSVEEKLAASSAER
jgi:hypothetical protein